LTDTTDHICFFRHALALDERRVKFLPEYVHSGVFHKEQQAEDQIQADKTGHPPVFKPTMVEVADPGMKGTQLPWQPAIKEVWFPGTHSDMWALSLPPPFRLLINV